ncbi:MAG: glycoside hydrolase family 2 protein [Bacteroidia bacterium]|nr:glycoside hydrolase family 2 protein [Bacteroidia bacterium]
MPLHSNWRFRKSGDAEWLPSTVPGTVHIDLLANKKIPDPFFGTNEKDLQWIEDVDWEYQTVFSVDEKYFQQSTIELQFEGLDTYAKIFLNDSFILSADNMFRRWSVDVKRLLKEKDNRLLIHFESAVKTGRELAKHLPYKLPGDEKVFTRKAQYQYGWDWGPRFVTCGIWKNIRIISWDEIKLLDVSAEQKSLNDSLAVINFRFQVNCIKKGKYDFSVSENSKTAVNKFFILIAGIQEISIPMEIKNPQRWWSNGLGEPYLYQFACVVLSQNKILDKKNISVGLRTIALIQENDTTGKSFYFKLNGVPVFMKGANWIPADNFLPRMTKEKYRKLLVKAKEANMNMLRVWGGGVYESNDFYSLCDSLGILVWQDFMFAGGMYPGDSSFVNNVREEVADNVKRLRNHPCIALWCGNNEIDEGWKNWGWQNQYNYSKKDSAKMWNDYLKIFHQTIPDIVSLYDNSRPYWESSPSIGWGHKESLTQGDSHYWGVWWGMEPFEEYEKKVGRFMSEYGFQGMPSLSTFRKFCDEKELSLTSGAVKNHQKHPTGYETIQKYLERNYKQPSRDLGIESYIYVSQLLQAEGMKTAIEAHRRAMPYCMGTLFWQLNDCWPVTSWSSIDYFNTPKAVYYTIQKAYSKYHISAELKDGNVTVTSVSDDTADTKAKFKISLTDFTGNILWSDSGKIVLKKQSSEGFYPIVLEDMVRGITERRVFFRMELTVKSTQVSENVFYFVKPKDLLLDKTEIQYSIEPGVNRSYSISLYTNSLAKNVFIDFGDMNVSLSDNYFDLFPKERKVITVFTETKLNLLNEKLKITSLVDSF